MNEPIIIHREGYPNWNTRAAVEFCGSRTALIPPVLSKATFSSYIPRIQEARMLRIPVCVSLPCGKGGKLHMF